MSGIWEEIHRMNHDEIGSLVINICNSLRELGVAFIDVRIPLEEYTESSRLEELPQVTSRYELRNTSRAKWILIH